jgi:CRP/FNR family cyclic AMP-dependent transcriptional regulator
MIALAALGKMYQDGEIVCRQGDPGDVLFVVQEGQLEVVREEDGRETLLRVAGQHEIVGEMAVFDRAVRSATVKARGTARVLTLDKKNFMRRLNEDPTLAFRMIETMARRVRDLSAQVVQLRAAIGSKGRS